MMMKYCEVCEKEMRERSRFQLANHLFRIQGFVFAYQPYII